MPSAGARDAADLVATTTDSDLPRAVAAATILSAWRTSARVTAFLVERLPDALWGSALPGVPNKTIRMLASHLHNARCTWIRTLGAPHGIRVPASVDRHRVGRRALLRSLAQSADGIGSLLALGGASGGRIPPTRAYRWRNLPLDLGHVLAYFVAHEGHHRGQIVLAARQLGQRLPAAVTDGLWQWTARREEVRGELPAANRPRAAAVP